MDALLAGGLLMIGLVIALGGFGAKFTIRLPGLEFVGGLGVAIALVGLAGLSGWI